MDLYINSPIRLHGVVFNLLSTGTTLPVPYTQSVGLLGRGISPSQGRYLHTEQHKTQNKRTQTSMPRVGFEPTTPVFERAKTDHALDGAATVIGTYCNTRALQIYIQLHNILQHTYMYYLQDEAVQ
jgi:hypothetical protein